MPKVSIGESSGVTLISTIEKVLIRGVGEYQHFFVEFFSSHSAESFHRGILWCFINFGYRKCFDKCGKGVSKFAVQFFFVSQCRKNSYENPLVFHYFRVSKNFLLLRVMSRFSVGNFLSRSAKKLVGEPFCAAFQK